MKRAKYLITIVVLFIFLGAFFALKKQESANLDDVELREQIKADESFVFFVEQMNGEYQKNEDSSEWPSNTTYEYDGRKSGCIDPDGNLLDGVLSYDGTKAVVNTNKTTYCYLYFKMKRDNLHTICYENTINNCMKNNTGLLSNVNNISTTLKGDMYRYQGTYENVTNNYLCFGTSSQAKCLSNRDKYLYRIIGVSEEGIKVIKVSPLENKYQWHTSKTATVLLENSNIFKVLNDINGTTNFLKNENYVPTNDNGINWQEKIINWNWKTGIKNNRVYMFGGNSAFNAYSKLSNLSGKVGLMYLHDYYYAHGNDNDSPSGVSGTIFSDSWITMVNNIEYTGGTILDWGFTNFGVSSGEAYARCFGNTGIVYNCAYTDEAFVRPVFYISPNVVIKGGTGSISSPYFIN